MTGDVRSRSDDKNSMLERLEVLRSVQSYKNVDVSLFHVTAATGLWIFTTLMISTMIGLGRYSYLFSHPSTLVLRY